jgi:hypothetical protein
MNGYNLTRDWYDYKFDNPEKVKHVHSDLYFYIIDLWNRLGQKERFGIPTLVTMEAVGIKSYNTYKNTLNDLMSFGFVLLVSDSKNQHNSKIIALSKINKAQDKAQDKALDKAHTKAQDKALDTIVKQRNKETKEQTNSEIPTIELFVSYALQQNEKINTDEVKYKYTSWIENGWKDGKGNEIKNWKSKLLNTLKYISIVETPKDPLLKPGYKWAYNHSLKKQVQIPA